MRELDLGQIVQIVANLGGYRRNLLSGIRIAAGYRSVVQRYPHIEAALEEIGPSLDPRFVEWFEQNVLSEQ